MRIWGVVGALYGAVRTCPPVVSKAAGGAACFTNCSFMLAAAVCCLCGAYWTVRCCCPDAFAEDECCLPACLMPESKLDETHMAIVQRSIKALLERCKRSLKE